jgi:hypothetical protein
MTVFVFASSGPKSQAHPHGHPPLAQRGLFDPPNAVKSQNRSQNAGELKKPFWLKNYKSLAVFRSKAAHSRENASNANRAQKSRRPPSVPD